MASMMHICSGLVGPKSGNVEKRLVLNVFLKEPKGGKCIPRMQKLVENLVFGGKSDEKTNKKKKNEPLDMRWQA